MGEYTPGIRSDRQSGIYGVLHTRRRYRADSLHRHPKTLRRQSDYQRWTQTRLAELHNGIAYLFVLRYQRTYTDTAFGITLGNGINQDYIVLDASRWQAEMYGEPV